MNDFTAARKRLHVYAKELHELADDIDAESVDLGVLRANILEQAAKVADYCHSIAFTDDARVAAAEIGRRIRALMGEGR